MKANPTCNAATSECRVFAVPDNLKTRILIVGDGSSKGDLFIGQLKKAQLDGQVKIINEDSIAAEYLTDDDSASEELVAIFLDLDLPSMDGLQLLEKVRSHAHTRHLPVIIMTSARSQKNLKQCHQWGVRSYVEKPITLQSFSKAIADSFHRPKAEVISFPLRQSLVETDEAVAAPSLRVEPDEFAAYWDSLRDGESFGLTLSDWKMESLLSC